MTGALMVGRVGPKASGLHGLHYGNRSPFFKMETQPSRLIARLFCLGAAALILPSFAVANARADAAAELASFSVFPKVDLAQLSKGEAKPVRSGGSANARHLAIQTAYVAPLPPAELHAKMRSWNP